MMKIKDVISICYKNRAFRFVLYCLKQVWDVFRDEQSKFRLVTALKMMSLAFLSFIVLFFVLWIFLRLNLVFFEANGYSELVELRDAYYDRIFDTAFGFGYYVGIFLIFNVFVGIYVSDLILRPFKLISDYCEKTVKDKNVAYDPDFFSELRLLTGISEYFIDTMEGARERGEFSSIKIPRRFTKIHRPVFEKGFFLQYSFFILITSICAVVMMYVIVIDTYAEVVQLSISTLKSAPHLNYYFHKQIDVLAIIVWVVLSIHILLSIVLSFNLYSKVARPAFAIFATMRSFLKGNYDSRVHLLGHYYLRPYCRNLNKYLDYLEKNIIFKG